jgi:hypothetical protein
MPVKWARYQRFSRLVIKFLKPQQPAVLVLSLPRSGSSWTGEALGYASNALYLREPVTQGAAEQGDQTFYDLGTVFTLDDAEIEAKYRRLADRSFAGWPTFSQQIASFPAQWNLRQRAARRVVIKEVNPLACQWYLKRYQPRLVFLVRHPAAVALSWQKNGWLPSDAEAWAKNGRHQATALQAAVAAARDYPLHVMAQYETLCVEPLPQFEKLFEFAGLTWDQTAHDFVAVSTGRLAPAKKSTRYIRRSEEMIDAWRGQMPAENLAALRAAFQQIDLPWYREDSAW